MEQSEATPEAMEQPETPDPVDSALEALGGEPEEEAEAEAEGAEDEAQEGADVQDEASAEDDALEGEQGEAAEDDLTPPEGLSERAQERFRNLASQVKELRQQVEAERERAEQVVSVLQQTGATPEELGQTLEFVSLAKKGDPESLRQAAEIARQWLQQVSARLGEPVEVDPLAAHNDLAERVETGELSREDAMQIVRARELERAQQQQAQAMTAQQQMEAQRQAEVAQAVQTVERMEAEWAKSDPDYPAKRELLAPKVEEIARTMSPADWPAAVRIAWDAINTAFEQSKQAGPSPISGGSARPTAARPEPKDLTEAAWMALEGQ